MSEAGKGKGVCNRRTGARQSSTIQCCCSTTAVDTKSEHILSVEQQEVSSSQNLWPPLVFLSGVWADFWGGAGKTLWGVVVVFLLLLASPCLGTSGDLPALENTEKLLENLVQEMEEYD